MKVFSHFLIPPPVTTQSFFTLSCFIFAWTSHSEKCSMLVSCRSISVSHTRMLSRAVSNSSRWPIKCWGVENGVAWNDETTPKKPSSTGSPKKDFIQLSYPSNLTSTWYSFFHFLYDFWGSLFSNLIYSSPVKVTVYEGGGVWGQQKVSLQTCFGYLRQIKLINSIPHPKEEIPLKPNALSFWKLLEYPWFISIIVKVKGLKMEKYF